MSDYFYDKLEAFCEGLAIIRAANGAASIQAEVDVIYVSDEGLTDEQRAKVLALGFGWHEASDVDSLGFFT